MGETCEGSGSGRATPPITLNESLAPVFLHPASSPAKRSPVVSKASPKTHPSVNGTSTPEGKKKLRQPSILQLLNSPKPNECNNSSPSVDAKPRPTKLVEQDDEQVPTVSSAKEGVKSPGFKPTSFINLMAKIESRAEEEFIHAKGKDLSSKKRKREDATPILPCSFPPEHISADPTGPIHILTPRKKGLKVSKISEGPKNNVLQSAIAERDEPMVAADALSKDCPKAEDTNSTGRPSLFSEFLAPSKLKDDDLKGTAPSTEIGEKVDSSTPSADTLSPAKAKKILLTPAQREKMIAVKGLERELPTMYNNLDVSQSNYFLTQEMSLSEEQSQLLAELDTENSRGGGDQARSTEVEKQKASSIVSTSTVKAKQYFPHLTWDDSTQQSM